MDKSTLDTIEKARIQVHHLVDEKFDGLITCCQTNASPNPAKQTVFPLSGNAAFFKGKKPSAVILGDKEVAVKTWRAAVATILRDSVSSPDALAMLLSLRGRVHGNIRSLLTDDPDILNAPIQISDKLYFEGKFDTEMLLSIVENKLLKWIDYDIQKISFTIRS